MTVFDARPLIASGEEPFGKIMEAVAALEPGEEFVLFAPFDPVPLESVLSSQGFSFEAEALGGTDWKVTFKSTS